jgi:hypothetical protein
MMTEVWDRDGGNEYGPVCDEAWVVDSLYEVPLPEMPERKTDMSLTTCRALIEKYNIPPNPKYIFPFELEQMQERLKR